MHRPPMENGNDVTIDNINIGFWFLQMTKVDKVIALVGTRPKAQVGGYNELNNNNNNNNIRFKHTDGLIQVQFREFLEGFLKAL
jgi:hypothetical protein